MSSIIMRGFAIITVGVGWALYWGNDVLQRATPQPLVAEKFISAVLAKDTNAAVEMTYAQERKVFNLEKADMKAVLEKCVYPRFEGCEVIGNPQVFYMDGGVQGVCIADILVPGGNASLFPCASYDEGETPKVMFTCAVLAAWTTAYIRKHNTGYTELIRPRAWLEGVRQDRKFLESQGVTGLWEPNVKGGLRTWDKLEETWSDIVAATELQVRGETAKPSRS